MSDDFRGPVSFSTLGWKVLGQRGLPSIVDAYKQHAALVDHFDEPGGAGDTCFAAVGRANSWPSLVVTQQFSPCQGGFDPGIAFVPSTQTVFIGAGTRVLGYRLSDGPARLWEDTAELGFWSWTVHDEAVLMSAELELAAWDHAGAKLWSCFVEPPWSYEVRNGRVRLDVMGEIEEFDVRCGQG